MKVTTTPQFDRAVKRLHPSEKTALDDAVKEVMTNPDVGELKVGDLVGVRVLKYRHHTQLMLLAYRIMVEADTIRLLLLGTHENFYRDLKRH